MQRADANSCDSRAFDQSACRGILTFHCTARVLGADLPRTRAGVRATVRRRAPWRCRRWWRRSSCATTWRRCARWTPRRSAPSSSLPPTRWVFCPHPGGNPGANLKSISHRCHPILVAFVWELTKETIHLPLGCLQGGDRHSQVDMLGVRCHLSSGKRPGRTNLAGPNRLRQR